MSKKIKSLKTSIYFICSRSSIILLVSLIILLAAISSLWSTLISFLHYRIVKAFKLLLFIFKLISISIMIRWNPTLYFWNFAENISFIFFADFVLEFLVIYSMLDIHAIALKTIFSFYFSSNFLVLLFIFLWIFNKFLNLFFWESSFIICYRYSSILWSSFIGSCYIHYTIFINLESNLYLRNSSWSWWNSV